MNSIEESTAIKNIREQAAWMDVRKLVSDIMMLALDFNKKAHGQTIFVEYAGHVDHISVRIYKEGWKAYADPTFERTIHGLRDFPSDSKISLEVLLGHMKLHMGLD